MSPPTSARTMKTTTLSTRKEAFEASLLVTCLIFTLVLL